MRTIPRLVAAAVGVAALTTAFAAPAAAHVSPDKDEVPAGGFTAVALTIGHGCETAATNVVEIQVPETILNVTPEMVPGWNVVVEKLALDKPVKGPHGEEFTERESVVRYTARPGNELPPDLRLSFTLGFQAPDTPGANLFFKTIQRCTEGETAWIEEYTGEGEEPEHPAPLVRVVKAESEDGSGDKDGDDTASTENAANVSDDDDSADGIAVAGLIAGILGLLAGGAALLRGRRTT